MEEKKKRFKFSPKIMIPILIVVMLVAAVCVFLWLKREPAEVPNGEEITEESPTPTVPTDEYTIGMQTIPVLTIPEIESAVADSGEGSDAVSYVYSSFPTPATAAEAYMRELIGETHGYLVVDKYFVQDSAPDFTKPTGTVRLAKATEEENWLNFVTVSWTESDCTVRLEYVRGIIDDVPEGMTLTEAFQYVKGLHPSELGLSGESMDEYQVYTESGTVLVGNRACMQISVHSRDNPEGTNDVTGYYLLSSDGRHIYRLDKTSGTVEELDF